MKRQQQKQETPLTTEEAFEIVYDLACQNILSDSEVFQDAEILGPMQQAQQEACDTVHDFIVNNIF